ncbi:uncharacterized protein BDZ99DRAFT_558045 [Mytilinidion resinicola]|uniref:NAD(P)-binding protein n=1 Tax=Mytilinidion resinicola TaxID=574789 RepID=A0A6A6YW42_9PEZI|nr:uncharacterized protein BDZ99DRAFT_558045 [Mytilinidion resinicola]KAF2812205.1 hypothetical protein BDZ99DRAFT_558045 [Mytilinidion resinicola]
MVSLDVIQSSNDRIRSALPVGLVAVFVGGTNGAGETTVRQFAKYTAQPRVYIVGCSQEAGDRITAECKELNPEGTFVFLQRETSLMRNVDQICKELASKEDVITLLCLTVGTLQLSFKTEEGLNYPTALTVHGHNRFISNLLPLIRRGKGLRRVVTTFMATFEGPIDMADFQGWNLGRMAFAGHKASVTTLALEAHHKAAPEVAFLHNFPGAVESGIARGSIGGLMRFLKTVWGVLGPLVHISLVEAGDRHLFFCTSARFSAGPEDEAAGVPLVDGLAFARGTDGQVGSGVYSIDEKGESAGAKVEKLLVQLRNQGMVERLIENVEADINGTLASGKDS